MPSSCRSRPTSRSIVAWSRVRSPRRRGGGGREPEDVRGDAEVTEEIVVLKDHADSGGVGLGDGAERPPLGVEGREPRTPRGERPREDLDQGRLPRAVLAEQRVHVSGAQLEVDVVQDDDARVVVADPLCSERTNAVRPGGGCRAGRVHRPGGGRGHRSRRALAAARTADPQGLDVLRGDRQRLGQDPLGGRLAALELLLEHVDRLGPEREATEAHGEVERAGTNRGERRLPAVGPDDQDLVLGDLALLRRLDAAEREIVVVVDDRVDLRVARQEVLRAVEPEIRREAAGVPAVDDLDRRLPP